MTIRKEVYDKHMLSLHEGHVVFTEGEKGDEMFIIIDGEVEITKRTSMETSKALITLKKGDIFGEMAIIEKKPRSASAIALKATHLLRMNEELFFSTIASNPDFATKVVKILSERLRRANALIQNLSNSSGDHRTYQGLLEFALKNGIDSIKGKRIIKRAFIVWAINHIGLNEEDITKGISILIEKKQILQGANTNELVVPIPTIQKN